MIEHSNVMGGSTAYRRINCPGSLKLEKAAPKQPESEYAARGSMLHAAMDLILTADPETEAEFQKLLVDLEGQNLGWEGHEITHDLIYTKIIPAWQAWQRLVKKYELDDWFIEQPVSLSSVIPGAFGTADVLAKDKHKRLHVMDWKFGDGVPVSPVGSYALGFYAGAALYDEDAELVEFCENITGVILHIIQPRVGGDDPLETWETTENWVLELIEHAVDAHAKALRVDPPLKSGDWCRFCRARATCPEQKVAITGALAKEPTSMTSVELGKALRLAGELKSWISEVVKLAEYEAENGASIPGFKLVNKRPTRVWTDVEAAQKILRNAKVPAKQMWHKKLISPAQAEKLNPRLYDKRLSDIVVFHSSGLTLVPDSDKRQAVSSASSLLANALPEQETGNRKKETGK